METHRREGVVKERSFQTSGNPLTGRSVGNFGISEDSIIGRKKKNLTDYAPNRSQQRSSPDTHVHQQRAGAEQGGTGCLLRVRTGPECPKDNFRD